MKSKKRFLIPVLFVLSFAALGMKKYMVPFHGFFLVVVFDGMAIVYLLRAFTSEKTEETRQGRSFNFDLSSIAYAVCSIAILYRLQYWEGWERWTNAAGLLFLIVSLLTFASSYFFLRLAERKSNLHKWFQAHLSWFYFLILFPVVAFTNPRTFHNLFNSTTYEEHVRTRYPLEKGNAMLDLYKPEGVTSIKRSDEYFIEGIESEKKKKYQRALFCYNQAIDYNPSNAAAVYYRGKLKLTKLEIDREMAQSAYNDFSRAIQLDSSMAAAYYHRAVAHNYLNNKNPRPAQLDLMKAKTLDSSLKDDAFIKALLALPLVDTSADTATFLK